MGSGKLNPTLRGLEENPGKKANLYVITRTEIEALDLSRLLADFSPENPKDKLLELCSQWHFVVSGYDKEREELFEIPEVRQFFTCATMVWPIWTFGAATTSLALWAVVLSALPTLDVRKENGVVGLSFDMMEVGRIFHKCMPVFLHLNEKAEIVEKIKMLNLSTIASYLGIVDL